MAGGVAVFDYDRDGKPDIFFTNGADINTLKKDSPKYWNRLFHNNGDGTFTDVTERAGLKGTGFDVGVAIGDYDNDGYGDIFVAGVYRNTLYHNNGDGTFTDVTEKAGLAHPDKQYGPLWSVAAAWVDINNDGLLDLFVVNYISWDGTKEPDCEYNGKPEYCHPKFYKATAQPALPEQRQRHVYRHLGASRDPRTSWQGHVGRDRRLRQRRPARYLCHQRQTLQLPLSQQRP